MRSSPIVVTILLTLGCPVGDDDGGGGMHHEESGGQADGDDEAGGVCVPGQAMPCTCADGSSGAQVCAADGSSYGACSCDGAADDGMGDDGMGDGAEDGPADSTGDGANDDGLDDSMNDGGSGDSSPEEVTWSGDIVPFLYDKCGAANGACHSAVAYNAEVDRDCLGWASFEDTLLGAVNNSGPEEGSPTGCPDLALDQRLINRSPWQCGAFQGNPTELLIVPFSADDSYMVKKMEGTLLCDDSAAMPPPNLMPDGQDQPITITYAEIQMVRDWIDAGAIVD